jgi:hypothetical protein
MLPGMWSTSLDLTDAYFCGFQEIPLLRVGQQYFSSCLSSPAHTIYPDSFLPGRFSCQGTQPRKSQKFVLWRKHKTQVRPEMYS